MIGLNLQGSSENMAVKENRKPSALEREAP